MGLWPDSAGIHRWRVWPRPCKGTTSTEGLGNEPSLPGLLEGEDAES